MWILRPHRPVRCNAPDSHAGQALRTGGALFIGAGRGERSACGIVAGQQTALVADAQSSIGELVDRYRAAHEMDTVAGSCRIRFLKVTVLSLRTIRSCLLDSTSSS